MRTYIKKSKMIVEGVQILMEHGVRKDLALSSATAAANKVPSRMEFADEPLVDKDEVTGFLADLLRPFMPDKAGNSKDEIISFEAPPPNPIAQLDALLGEIQAQDRAARAVGAVLGGTPTQSSRSSFAQSKV